MPEEVILLLGSNAGRRVRLLRDGITALSGAVEIGTVSRIYGGEPSGRADQPWYLNVAVRGHTVLSPEALLRFVKNIEAEAGRKAGARWGPRVLDIDIVLMGDRVVHEPHLAIPHPLMAFRRFCLVPVAEVASEVRVPPGPKTVADLLGECLDPLEVSPI
ncbi:MAG TPA: 2-amino-4-hydroxy-6-hydroxymethyldihydropteridine diphosphokinase [Candidatus Deferrimicrobiaceae bacterium]|nr:2-amino-4-hydroxy-6-hydroxymethyldihydropteridine diphosphokinase [Candidatus Deferrimicrobiaceae bacterium]